MAAALRPEFGRGNGAPRAGRTDGNGVYCGVLGVGTEEGKGG
jgi:hypothetical protein